MDSQKMYTANELAEIVNLLRKEENGALPEVVGKRIRDKVLVNDKEFWLSGYTNQELHEAYVNVLEKEGLVQRIEPDEEIPLFKDYVSDFYETYKTKQQGNTLVNRKRIIKNHLIPKFGDWRIDRITTTSVQKWFNELAATYSKETIMKIKNTMSPVMDSAVEDELIMRNPFKSKRLENNGRDVKHHKAIPKEKFALIKDGLYNLDPKVRYMGALLCYTGMRYEEVLGIRFEDISRDGWISICRAVVHPNRNQPTIKCTKTKTSDRLIPASPQLLSLLSDGPKKGFILATNKDPTRETPMSYTEARRVYNKLQKAFELDDYSPHDFRDTCATTWRESGMPLDVIARMLGHARTETTERRYVKYRPDLLDDYRDIV